MTHNLSYIEYEAEGEPSAWDYQFNPNSGQIHCMQCSPREIWCSHVEAMTRVNAESQAIFEIIDVSPQGEAIYRDQFVMDIPVFPTHTFWTQVILTPAHRPGFPMYSVEWDKPEPDGQIKDTLFICHITQGEGRKSIREMLFELMWATNDRAIECKASHHGLAAQVNWQNALQNTATRTLEAWSLFMTEWCTYCTIHQASNDDLIPAAENTGVWS